MSRHISLMTVVVKDYDEAIAFYVGKLGFSLKEDTVISPDKRWVVVCPSSAARTGVLLAQAATPQQEQIIGAQSGGRVLLFLETDEFWVDFEAFSRNGVKFLEKPRLEPYGDVVVFEDLYGNLWDLIQRR